MPPRAARPIGVALVDKPAGPSSFALVAGLRRQTGARTGHAGTLDPFATGLLILLSGLATKLVPCFVGLDKRYTATIDLTATTSSGDLTGEILERHDPPSADELAAMVDGLRGEVELPIPAISAVKIDGERAYRLARRGVEVEMPLRRSRIFELVATSPDASTVELEAHVESGTYIRSLAVALGGHCVSLRRTAVGPFGIDEAAPEQLHPVAEILARLPESALDRVPAEVRERVLEAEREPHPA